MSEALYEYIPGSMVRHDWGDEEVPVPPVWVREAVDLPPRFQFATYAEEVEDEYHPELLSLGVDYIKNWPVEARHGRAPLLLGTSGVGKTWAAAGMVNEIFMRYGLHVGLLVKWLSVKWHIPTLMDYHKFRRTSEYFSWLKELREAHLLVIDDILFIQEKDFQKSKSFLVSLFECRFERKLPTIITANAHVTRDDWSSVEDVLGEPFVRRMRDNAEGLTVVI